MLLADELIQRMAMWTGSDATIDGQGRPQNSLLAQEQRKSSRRGRRSDRDRSKKRKVVERESYEPSKLTDTIFFLNKMENNTEEVEQLGLNKSLFFIQPHSDPDLLGCTGFYLKSDLAVSI